MKSALSSEIILICGVAAGFYFFRTTPQDHVKYEVAHSPLAGMTSIALDSQERIFIAGSFGVRKLDDKDLVVTSWQTAEEVCALAIDAEDNVYTLYATMVEKFDATGKSLLKWGKGGCGGDPFGYATGLCVAEDQVFIADADSRLVFRYNRQGEPFGEITSRVENATGVPFFIPTPYFDCCIKENTLLVVNPGHLRVEQYTYDGELLGYWGKAGAKDSQFPGCSNPSNLAVFADGRILVSQKGDPCLKIFSHKGEFISRFASALFSDSARGIDLAIDRKGTIIAVDPVTAMLHRFSPDQQGQQPL